VTPSVAAPGDTNPSDAIEDYGFCVAFMIWAMLVNTHTHTQRKTAFDFCYVTW